MKLRQLSLFLQNEPGALTSPCKLLAAAGVNIITFALADTQQFGIFRMIVEDEERAKHVLEQSGYVVKLTEVVAVEVPDRPGGLAEVLEVIERGGVNVEYVYAFTVKRVGNGVLVFRFSAPDAAVRCLTEAGIPVLSTDEIARRMAG
jgi:hypothetical protein